MSFNLKWVFKNKNGEDSSYTQSISIWGSMYTSGYVNDIQKYSTDFSSEPYIIRHKFYFINWSYVDQRIEDGRTYIYTAVYSEDLDTSRLYSDSGSKASYIGAEFNLAMFCLHDTSNIIVDSDNKYSPRFVYGSSNRENLTYYNHTHSTAEDFFKRFYNPDLDSNPWIKFFGSDYRVNGDKLSFIVKGTAPSPFYLETKDKKVILGQTPDGGNSYLLAPKKVAPNGFFSLAKTTTITRDSTGFYINSTNYTKYFEDLFGYIPWVLTLVLCAKGGKGGTGVYTDKVATGKSTQSFTCGGGGGSGATCVVILDFTKTDSFVIETMSDSIKLSAKGYSGNYLVLENGKDASGRTGGEGGYTSRIEGTATLEDCGIYVVLTQPGKAGGDGGYVYKFKNTVGFAKGSYPGESGVDLDTKYSDKIFLDKKATIVGAKGGTSYYSAITDKFTFAVSGGGGGAGLVNGGTGGDCINIYDGSPKNIGTGESGLLNSGGGGGGCYEGQLKYSLENSSGGPGGSGGFIIIY